jgi:hypothetical protein
MLNAPVLKLSDVRREPIVTLIASTHIGSLGCAAKRNGVLFLPQLNCVFETRTSIFLSFGGRIRKILRAGKLKFTTDFLDRSAKGGVFKHNGCKRPARNTSASKLCVLPLDKLTEQLTVN